MDKKRADRFAWKESDIKIKRPITKEKLQAVTKKAVTDEHKPR